MQNKLHKFDCIPIIEFFSQISENIDDTLRKADINGLDKESIAAIKECLDSITRELHKFNAKQQIVDNALQRKRLTSDDQEDGENIYIGAIDSNNGVANHIAQEPIKGMNTEQQTALLKQLEDK